MKTTTYSNTVAERARNENTGPAATSLTKTIPFDYVFEFKLKGKDPKNVQDVVKLQDVVEISMQGVFVGVAIGYSFVLDESKTPPSISIPTDVDPIPPNPVILRVVDPGETDPVGRVLFGGNPNADITILKLTETQTERLIYTSGPTDDILMFQDVLRPLGSNQSEALFRTGPDGIGDLTFFENIGFNGLHIWDRGNNLISQPFQSGVIGPNPSNGGFPKAGDKIIYVYGVESEIASVLLFEGRTGKCFQVKNDTGAIEFPFDEKGWAEVKIFVSETDGQPAVEKPLSPGDLILVRLTGNSHPPTVFAVSSPRAGDISVGALLKGLRSSNAGITSGVRPTQRLANLLAANPPLGSISQEIFEKAFELARGPEDVSFLYSIDIVSTGRELQNKPIHNIAGLGIANGDRPFRPFARPIAFEPRSVIRIQIEELSTLPGTLYIVLQGYKTLGTGRRPE
jgi:hypothetical protein